MNLDLAFVDSATANPTVRLSLNNDQPWRLLEDSRFDPPPLRYATASTLLVDGEHVSASAYGNRTIVLRLMLLNVTEDQAATHLQSLMRELNRPSNILRYRPGTTEPTFFQTIRASADSVVFDAVSKEATVSIPAKSYGIGPKETLGGPLNSNPYFETDVSNWTPAGGTFVRSTAQFHQGVASGLLTPDGVSAQVITRAEMVAATAGSGYTGSVWVRCAAARNVSVTIDWHNPTLFSGSGSTVAVAANTWTLLTVTATAPATTTHARLTVSMDTTPPAGHLLHIDEATLSQSFVVNNDPAASTNGMFFDVTGIKGDVEAPLHLVVAGSMVTNPNAGPRTSAIAVRRRGTPSSAPFLLQAESMTQVTDTTTQPNSALFSGSSNNYSRTTFASPTMSSRLTTTVFPGTAGVDVRGTYRVFVRYRFSTSASPVVNVRLLWGTSGGTATLITGDTVPLLGDNGGGAPYLKYADLGLVQIPPGYDPVTDGPSGTEIATEGIYIQVQAERTSGSASVDWDFLLFLPADDRTLLAKWPTASSAPTDLVLNSREDAVYARNASGQVVSMPFARLAGGSPMVSPGVTNRVYFVRDVGPDTSTAGSGAGDDITATTAVTPFYWPRYLVVKPAST